MGKKNRISILRGFTIVELLIIIVVIAILAAITIVSYSAITKNSREQSVNADLTSVSSELAKYKADKGVYPTVTQFNSDIKKSNSSGGSAYSYVYDSTRDSYCLAVTGYSKSFHLESSNTKASDGDCGAATPVTVVNMLRNPSFASGSNFSIYATSTGAPQTTALRTNSDAHSGNTYVRVSFSGTGSQTITYSFETASIGANLQPNTPYTLSAKIRPSKALTFNANFSWTTSGGTTFNSPVTSIAAPAGSWTTISLSGQSATHTDVDAVIATAAGSTWASGDTLDLDSMMLTQGTTVYEYRDGSYPGWSWNTSSAPNNSASTGPSIPEVSTPSY